MAPTPGTALGSGVHLRSSTRPAPNSLALQVGGRKGESSGEPNFPFPARLAVAKLAGDELQRILPEAPV